MDMGMEDLMQAEMLAAMSPGGASSATAGTGGGSDQDEAADLRRGPWTVEEDVLLVNYVAAHGEGRWNSLARAAGLRRTGKSCRLRWLNYLRPDVRRGNITAQEQLLILDLHSRWGNRWSKIAHHLPGRTDNEVKNYWRTRVQKHAKQLRCDVNSRQFRDVVRHVWMPRLVERIQAEAAAANAAGGCGQPPEAAVAPAPATTTTTTASAPPACQLPQSVHHRRAADYYSYSDPAAGHAASASALSPDNASSALHSSLTTDASSSHGAAHHYSYAYTSAATPTNEGSSSGAGVVVQCGGDPARRPTTTADGDDVFDASWSELLATAGRDEDDCVIGLPDFEWFGDLEDSNLWSLEDLCLQQLC